MWHSGIAASSGKVKVVGVSKEVEALEIWFVWYIVYYRCMYSRLSLYHQKACEKIGIPAKS